jgi:chitinase
MASLPAGEFSHDDDGDEQRLQLSVPRVVLTVLMVAALIVGTALTIRRSVTRSPEQPATTATWFAPYLDTTLTPLVQFQDPSVDPARQVVLGFVVADADDACLPSWGGYYGLQQASSALNLDRRIAELRTEGSDVVVSFGGAANSELAVTCTNQAELTTAYASVIARYGLTTVDFDLEGSALSDVASIHRRAAALASLQRSARAAGRKLAVWLTVPSTPSGLASSALSVVASTLAAGVELAGVDVMAMDFGAPEADMGAAVRASLVAAHAQLARTYASYRVTDSSTGVWNRMGVTVMIGQNDSAGEIFTTADATALVDEARAWRPGRVSMWSLNRDEQCGSRFAVVGVHSNTCSGTVQGPLAFSRTFATLSGSAADAAGSEATMTPTNRPVIDSPSADPYPEWQATRPYVAGYLVVCQGNVYEAKWYNQSVDPAAQLQDAYASPWQLIGPVLPGNHAPTTTTLPAGTYPAWSPTAIYEDGSRVLYAGLPYEARWYNTATSPAAESADPPSSPWTPMFTIPGEPSGS